VAAPNIRLDEGGDSASPLITGNFVIRTDYDETVFPVFYRLSSATLVAVPETISFKDCFIGTEHSRGIRVGL
jgi:hypothetical protein